MQIQQVLERALALHQSGQLPQAQDLYEKILQASPRHADALHLLGVAALQTGQYARAANLINRAIAEDPSNAGFYSNLGLALQGNQEAEAAILCFNQAIALDPNFADAYFNRGLSLYAIQQIEEAIASYSRAIELVPAYVQAYVNRGAAFHAEQHISAAIEDYTAALRLNPLLPEVHGRLGLALQQSGQLDAALVAYNQAIQLQPDDSNAYSNRGVTLQALNHLDAALASHQQAIALNPGSAEAYVNRGATYQALGRLDQALADFNRAIDLKPGYAAAYSNRGTVLQGLNRLDAALADHQQAITLQPDYAEAYANLGSTLHALNLLGTAIACYDHALRLNPEHATGHTNRAMALLLAGDFSNGWPAYEWRWRTPKGQAEQRHFPQPLWLGKMPLEGKTLLLYAEQGLGDALQFCRYAAQLDALGARIVIETPAPLFTLFASVQGIAERVVQGNALPAFDYHCPLLSLPLALGATPSTIPQPVRYLSSTPEKRAYWANKLGKTSKRRVGLVWSGNKNHVNDHNRSIPLPILKQNLPEGFAYVSLQRELRDADAAFLQSDKTILHFGQAIHDFSDTAALCDLMDLVISVDTSVAHLSAALGQPTWILLPFSPDWRWLLNRSDSPWYPSATLYRQATTGDWHSVLDKLRRDLLDLPPAPAV